jgi:hypothetical protein
MIIIKDAARNPLQRYLYNSQRQRITADNINNVAQSFLIPATCQIANQPAISPPKIIGRILRYNLGSRIIDLGIVRTAIAGTIINTQINKAQVLQTLSQFFCGNNCITHLGNLAHVKQVSI